MGILQEIQRDQLVKDLRRLGITDSAVLAAISRVRREYFVPSEMKRYAYENVALPLEGNQTISQPYTVAFMTHLLDIKGGEKVLEVGTGSGYQAAVLKELGADVYSVERVAELFTHASKTLEELGYSVRTKFGDGTLGWKEHSPFDRIIVTAGAPNVPDSLLEQLAVGGKLVIPVGSETSQEIFVIERKPDEKSGRPMYDYKSYRHFRFVPLIGQQGWHN